MIQTCSDKNTFVQTWFPACSWTEHRTSTKTILRKSRKSAQMSCTQCNESWKLSITQLENNQYSAQTSDRDSHSWRWLWGGGHRVSLCHCLSQFVTLSQSRRTGDPWSVLWQGLTPAWQVSCVTLCSLLCTLVTDLPMFTRGRTSPDCPPSADGV